MRQNGAVVCTLLRQRLCAPLAHAYAVTVAPCGKGEGAALPDHRKAGAAQPQRLAQGGTLHRLSADRQAVYIAGGGEHRRAEPLRLLRKVGGDTQPFGQQLL